MVIRNKTKFTEQCMQGAMRAANFDNNRYKAFKMIYNIFGLLFGMMLIRYLVFEITGSEQADKFMIVFYAVAAAIFLYIGMVGMDRNHKRKYHSIYGRMVGVTFTYAIDAEQIIVTDEEDDSDEFSWDDIIKWTKDADFIYLFVSSTDCLVIDKNGFEEGTDEDLSQLAEAVMGLRRQSDEADSEN